MTTTDQLAAIEARANAATKGPWEALTDPGDRKTAPAWIVDADEIEVRLPATYRAGKVAEFIAHARTDVPALVALVREQAAQLERAEALADEWARELENPDHLILLEDALCAIRTALAETP